MSNNVFSNFQTANNAANNTYLTNNNKQSSDKKIKLKTVADKAKKIAPVIIPLAAIPVTAIITYKVSSKNFNGLKESISGLSDEIKNITRDMAKLEALQDAKNTLVNQSVNEQAKTSNKANALLWSAILGITGFAAGKKADDLTDDDKKNIIKNASERYDDISSKTRQAINTAEQ